MFSISTQPSMHTASAMPPRLTGDTAVWNRPRLDQAPVAYGSSPSVFRTNSRPEFGTWLARLLVALLGTVLVLLSGCAGSKTPDPSTSALHFFQRGNAAYLDQDYPGAVRWYQRAQDANPMSPDIAYNLGLAYFQTGALELAVKAFQQALRLDPNFADAHMNLALAYDRLYDRATAHYHYNQYQSLAMSQAPVSAQSAVTAAAAPSPAARRTPRPQGASAPGGPLKADPDSEKATTKRHGQTAPAQAQQRTGGTQRSTQAPQAQAPEPATPQGTDKWWIQDQKPSPW